MATPSVHNARLVHAVAVVAATFTSRPFLFISILRVPFNYEYFYTRSEHIYLLLYIVGSITLPAGRALLRRRTSHFKLTILWTSNIVGGETTDFYGID